MQLETVTPVLRSFDGAKARAFYVDYLGFTVDWQHRFEPAMPLYMQVSRGAVLLHMTEHHGDATPGSAVRIGVSDVDALWLELQGRPYANARPAVEPMPWGSREMSITDPFGNRLTFHTPGKP